jgi:hypothetical protein
VLTIGLHHTYELDDATVAAIHGLLVETFADGFDADDWDHALGGIVVRSSSYTCSSRC